MESYYQQDIAQKIEDVINIQEDYYDQDWINGDNSDQ